MGDVVFVLGAFEQVHGGGANESGHKHILGGVVKLAGGAGLLQNTAVEHGNAVAHGKRLGLVVRHIEGGDAKFALQGGDFGTGLHPQFRIQVRKRLVHEEHFRLPHNGAAHGHTLPLAARECFRLTIQVGQQVQALRHGFHLLINLILGHTRNLEGKPHVFPHRHVWVERIVLEHHGDIAFFRWRGRHIGVTDQDAAGGHVLQAGQHAQGCGLAAARRANEH